MLNLEEGIVAIILTTLLHEFNFSDVPSNAIITNFRVLIKCYRNSYQRTDVDKNNNPMVNCTYILPSVAAAYNLVVTIGDAVVQIYLKENGSWVPYSKVYKKINGSWVEQTDFLAYLVQLLIMLNKAREERGNG